MEYRHQQSFVRAKRNKNIIKQYFLKVKQTIVFLSRTPLRVDRKCFYCKIRSLKQNNKNCEYRFETKVARRINDDK